MAVVILLDAQQDLHSLQEYMLDQWPETDWLKAEDMANTIMYVMNQPKHVVIDELMIHPLSQDY